MGHVDPVNLTTPNPVHEEQVKLCAADGAVVDNLNAFLKACLGIAPYRFRHEEMIHDIEVREAIALSADTRDTVHLGA